MISLIEEKENFQILEGRQHGYTVFGENNDHWFKYQKGGTFIHQEKWGEYIDLIVLREVSERGNETKSVLKILGLINVNNILMTKEKGFIVPKSKIKRIENTKEKEYISKIVADAYKTEEDIEFW